jgi:hypothetical protein
MAFAVRQRDKMATMRVETIEFTCEIMARDAGYAGWVWDSGKLWFHVCTSSGIGIEHGRSARNTP